jgi:hypothetical protein
LLRHVARAGAADVESRVDFHAGTVALFEHAAKEAAVKYGPDSRWAQPDDRADLSTVDAALQRVVIGYLERLLRIVLNLLEHRRSRPQIKIRDIRDALEFMRRQNAWCSMYVPEKIEAEDPSDSEDDFEAEEAEVDLSRRHDLQEAAAFFDSSESSESEDSASDDSASDDESANPDECSHCGIAFQMGIWHGQNFCSNCGAEADQRAGGSESEAEELPENSDEEDERARLAAPSQAVLEQAWKHTLSDPDADPDTNMWTCEYEIMAVGDTCGDVREYVSKYRKEWRPLLWTAKMQAAFLVVARAANSGGPGGPPGPLGLAIPYDSGPLPTESAGDLMEVAYHRPPWLSGSYHPRSWWATPRTVQLAVAGRGCADGGSTSWSRKCCRRA